jgi:hypothetical protein
MSDSDSLPIEPIRSKTLYRHHTNASREIALVDFLNDGYTGGVREYEAKEGLTIHDRDDMYRMGKKQELKVLLSAIVSSSATDSSIAQLPTAFCTQLCRCLDRDMGVSHDCVYARSCQWRARWSVLELYLDVCRFHFRGDEFSRDGVDVRKA